MSMILYIFAAIVIFGVLIAVHEWGHFIAARLCGVTVHEFAIGMGPALYQKEKKGTKYAIRLHPLPGTDVAGVDADFIHPLAGALQSQAVVKVDVRHQGDVDAALDGPHSFRRRHVGHRHPDDLAAGSLQLMDLVHRGGDVVGPGGAHGLDGHRGPAPDGDVSHHDLPGHGQSPPALPDSSFSRA